MRVPGNAIPTLTGSGVKSELQSSEDRTIRIGSSPTCFGIQRAIPPGAWKPEPLAVLDAVSGLGYEGISLGPPGYLGDAATIRQRLTDRRLALVEAFIPFHFTREDQFRDERAATGELLSVMIDASFPSDRPLAVIADGFRDPMRWGYAGRIRQHPELQLPAEKFPMLIDNIHRVAEDCRSRGIEPVLHHHAGTFIETDAEVRRVVEALDSSLVGLCLDTGHATFGGSDSTSLVNDYASLIRHVHLKDVTRSVIATSEDRGLDFTALTVAGAFCPLGLGDAEVANAISALNAHGYKGWFVVEQDRFLFEQGEFDDVVGVQRDNLHFLNSLGLK